MCGDEEFIGSVIFFHKYKDDVTRFTYWDEGRCKLLMPAFHKAWKELQISKDVMDRISKSYEDE